MKTVSENRRARFDYGIEETFEAGVELLGTEVKSIKEGRINLAGSYVVIRKNEAWLLNTDVPPYQPKNAPPDYDPKRSRRLLFRHEEIKRFEGKLHEKGLALLPLRVYLKNGLVKIEVGLGKSRKKADKREVIKKRSSEREMQRLGDRDTTT